MRHDGFVTDEAWRRLAGAVRARRDELGFTQAELAVESGVSEPTIRVIETARRGSYQRATLRAIAQALGWTPDSLDRILRGEEPVEAGKPDERPDFAQLEIDVKELKRQLAAMSEELDEWREERERTSRPPGTGA